MIRVGPAGWSYQDWEGIVYPSKKGSKFDPLVYLAEFFDTIELNNTFYRPPTLQMSKSWARRAESNPSFKFTAKLYRNFTHERQSLTEADEGVFRAGSNRWWKPGAWGHSFSNFPTLSTTTRKIGFTFKIWPTSSKNTLWS